jgi:DNA invertase Pin-like site-specific DNA recombinase
MAVETYLNGGRWKLISEFVEVESGRRSDRPVLAEALKLCRAHRAALVVAKVDRLTRSAGFLHKLLDSGVDVRFCDLPQIEGPTGKFLIQQMASVAELEAGFISARTKAALAATRARGTILGGSRGYVGTAENIARARAARAAKADEQAEALAPILKRLDPDGVAPLRTVADALNAEDVPTPSGSGRWTAIAVSRLRQRLARMETA